MRALVTGGSGFLGRYIVEQLLQRGVNVTVLCRGHYPELTALPIRVEQGSVTDPDCVRNAMANQDWVFHVAAKVGYWGSYDDFYNTNVNGTQLIVKTAKALGVKKLIYTSSPSVTMNNIDIHNGNESLTYPKKYHSYYSATKAIAEQHVLAAHEANGLHTTAIRPHLILGPRDNHLLPRLLHKAQTGQLKQIGWHNNRVGVTYVENAAHAHILAALSDNTGGKAYFINEPEPVTLWPWLRDILKQLGAPPPRFTVPFTLAFGAGWFLETLYKILKIEKEPLVTRFIAAELYRNHYFSIERARRDFNYKPLFSIEEAQEKTLAYVKANS